MALFPLFANLEGRPVLVVGGGEIAARKIHLLQNAGAIIKVVAKRVNATIDELAQQGQLQVRLGAYEESDLNNIWLVVAATDDLDLNTQIAAHADARRLFSNVVDNAGLSSFQVPAIVDRSPVTIAISSSGAAPMVARRVRAQIETMVDHSIGAIAELAQRYRNRIKQKLPALAPRRAFYDWVLDGPVAEAVKAQQPEQAEALLNEALEVEQPTLKGQVILVGAGPGDPGLLSLHALRALNLADVILYDRLVDPAILELARRDATQIHVGKQVGEDHHATQARIHQLMRDYAQQGQTVVRLKGGDAFIFGRGGEELQFLREHNVPYQVVPGITAALACAAYSGIPLTHREYAQSVQFVTAHRKEDAHINDWTSLCDPTQTLVVYMGLKQIAQFNQMLVENGREATTPCAIVENGSRPQQRTLLTRLDQAHHYASQHGFSSPSLLIVGPVAALAKQLHWYGQIIDEYPDLDLSVQPQLDVQPLPDLVAA
ncbi:MAG TPA: siroheme synthase CysG [Paenalcaligenes sp.]|nr:siroheme synthase CysG [Paenalcaligenes sp.]